MQRLTKMLTDGRTSSIHKPELLCNPANNKNGKIKNKQLLVSDPEWQISVWGNTMSRLGIMSSYHPRPRFVSLPIRDRGRHLVFPIQPKNTNLVEDVEILLPFKFRWISQSEALAAILFFRSAKETQSSFQGGHLVFLISPLPNLVEDVEMLLSVKFSEFRSAVSEENLKICLLSSFLEFPSVVSEEKSKMCQPIRGLGGHFVSDRPEKHKLCWEHWYLASCKVCWSLSSGFRGEVENVSANQRPGRPFCFSDRPEKHKLGRGRWDLASC